MGIFRYLGKRRPQKTMTLSDLNNIGFWLSPKHVWHKVMYLLHVETGTIMMVLMVFFRLWDFSHKLFLLGIATHRISLFLIASPLLNIYGIASLILPSCSVMRLANGFTKPSYELNLVSW